MKKKNVVKKIIIVATIALTLTATVSAASNEKVIKPLHEQDAG